MEEKFTFLKTVPMRMTRRWSVLW